MNTRQQVTIKDVANLANVSVATVSRTLSDPDVVAEGTRVKVMAAVEKLNYQPNALAQSMRRQRSKNILALVPDIENPFFSKIISSMQRRAHGAGYSVLLANTHNDPRTEREFLSIVYSKQADAIIQLGSEKINLETRNQSRIPTVHVCEGWPNDQISTVRIDNMAAAGYVAKHLLDLGHRRIAIVTGPASSLLTSDRLKGFMSTLLEEDVGMDGCVTYEGDFTISSGARAAEKILQGHKRPTAIFCFSDAMAFGCMNRLHDYGMRVPDDMSVVGFDDIEFASVWQPKLTTVSQPVEALGVRAVEILLDELSNDGSGSTVDLILPASLVIRESSCAPLDRSE